MSLGVATPRKKMPKKQRDAGVTKSGKGLLLELCTSRLVSLQVTTKTGGRTTRKLVLTNALGVT